MELTCLVQITRVVSFFLWNELNLKKIMVFEMDLLKLKDNYLVNTRDRLQLLYSPKSVSGLALSELDGLNGF